MEGLEGLLQRIVGELGFELVDFELSRRNKQLRIFIDNLTEVDSGPEKSVTIGECEAVSRQLQRVLPVEGIEYDRLEVSSPGLDRKLKKAGDFVRFTGRTAELRLREPLNGRRKFVGKVCGVIGDQVELEVEGQRLLFGIAGMAKARLVPVFDLGGKK